MERAKRQANYELLRIIAMIMVVTLHYLNHTGMLLMPDDDADAAKLLGTFMESLSIVAVNVYVLISGYFLTESGFKVRRLLTLICQVLFYALLIPVIMVGAGTFVLGNEKGFYRLLSYLFPIQTEHYWFATSYVLMYLFSPVLNSAVRHMGKRRLQITIAGLLFVFCVIKSIMPVRLVTDRFGYDFGWFLCVYLVAAYIRLYGIRFFRSGKKAWLVYVVCVSVIFAVASACWYINRKTGALAYYMTVPFHYNYMLCLLGAVALFCAFGHITIKSAKAVRVICALSPFTFGVYLFHEHMDIRSEWTVWIEEFLGPAAGTGISGLLLHWLVSVAAVYLAGTFIDIIRFNIFRFFGRYLTKTRLAQRIYLLDGEKGHEC